LTLGEPEKKEYKQPVLFEEAKDLFAPTIVEETTPVVQMPTAPVVETTKIEFVLEPVPVPEMMHTPVEKKAEEFVPVAAAKEEPAMQQSMNPVEHTREVKPAGGFLKKPAVIYAEPKEEFIPEIKAEEKPVELPAQLRIVKDEEESFSMQLVEKKEQQPAEKELRSDQNVHLASSEEPPVTDEAEEQRKKAAERLQKLRNLSFNIHAADPNNEFDNVPAYLRRNLELYNTISSAENFYSNYTVQSDENNQGQINTINTFLDGKKPD
jgi:cell division protein FtsZ